MSISALRTWLRIVGVLYLISGIGWAAASFGGSALSAVGLIMSLLMVAFSFSYLYVSKKFSYFLQTSTVFVQRLLYFTVAFSLLLLLVQFIGSSDTSASLGIAIPSILFWTMLPLYLLFNVKRIEEEHILEDDEL